MPPAVMAADNDIADVESIDREFGHRREVPVVGCDDVADIAVGKDLAGPGLGDGVHRYPRVGAADLQHARVLLVAEVGEVVPVLLENLVTKRRLPSSGVLIVVPSSIQFLWPVSWHGKIAIPIHREQSCPHA